MEYQNYYSIYIFRFLSGDGGNAGTLKVLVTRVDGNVELRSCRGTGAPPGTNGQGGHGKEIYQLFIVFTLATLVWLKREGIFVDIASSILQYRYLVIDIVIWISYRRYCNIGIAS